MVYMLTFGIYANILGICIAYMDPMGIYIYTYRGKLYCDLTIDDGQYL